MPAKRRSRLPSNNSMPKNLPCISSLNASCLSHVYPITSRPAVNIPATSPLWSPDKDGSQKRGASVSAALYGLDFETLISLNISTLLICKFSAQYGFIEGPVEGVHPSGLNSMTPILNPLEL